MPQIEASFKKKNVIFMPTHLCTRWRLPRSVFHGSGLPILSSKPLRNHLKSSLVAARWLWLRVAEGAVAAEVAAEAVSCRRNFVLPFLYSAIFLR